MSTVGQNIKIYREALGIPLQIFADRVNIPMEQLYAIERGKAPIKDFLLLYRICENLNSGKGGMRLEELLESDGREKRLPMELPKYVREYILEQRNKRGLTSKQLGEKLDISQPTIERLIAGNYGNPRPSVLQNVLAYFGTKASDLNNYYLSYCERGKTPVGETPNEQEETQEQEVKQEVSLTETLYSLDDIVKLSQAVKIFKNVDTCIAQIDSAIQSLESIKKVLRGGD